MLTDTPSTASLPAGSSSWLRTSGSSPTYRVLWRLHTRAPDRLHTSWVSVRAATETEAVAMLLHLRPDWTVLEIQREANP